MSIFRNFQSFLKTDTAKKAAGNAGWIIAFRVLKLMVSFFVVVMIARYLGVEDYGKLVFALVLAEMAMNLIGPGIHEIIVKQLSEFKNKQRQEEIVNTSFTLILLSQIPGLLVAILALFLITGEFSLLPVLLCVGGYYMFHSFDVIEFWYQHRLKSHIPLMIKAVATLISSGLHIIMVWMEAPLVAFSAVFMAQTMLMGAGYVSFFYFRDGMRFLPTFNPLIIKRIFKLSLPLILTKTLILFFHKADVFLLGTLSDSAAVGLYGVAIKFTDMLHVLPYALAISVLPVLTSASEQERRSWSILYYRISIWGGLSISLILAFILPIMVPFIFGMEYAFSGEIASIHIITFFFIMVLEALKIRLIVRGMEYQLYWIYAIALIFNIGLNMYLIPHYGAIGAATAAVISYALCAFILPWFFITLKQESRFMWQAIIPYLSRTK